MARVFLINPPSPEPVRSPLLSFCYLASALERAGHSVGILDASAVHGVTDPDEIARRASDFRPDLVGLHVKTLHAQPAYALARILTGRWPLVAGGPHPTVAPTEALAHGFTFSVRGEGEEPLVELADALDGKGDVRDILGLSFRDRASLAPGGVRENPPRGFLLDLDALASPVPALRHFDSAWYGQARPVPFAGILSSRGCPAACTFCSNNVTGRRFRYRSARAVADEVRDLRDHFDLGAFAFFDDSFAVGRRRVEELSAALTEVGSVPWSCTAHPAHLDPEVLAVMKRAGCGGIDIGMESADPARLIAIGKGITVERVLQVIAWCHDAGLHVVVNLMFGWPGETEAEIERALSFMEHAATLGAMFNARGVLVPYPGTEIYDIHHEQYGFKRWWLDQPPLEYTPFPTVWDQEEVMRAYADDAAFDRNFFRLPKEVLRLIQEAMDAKARLTYARVASPLARKAGGVPAAGAR
ncbi:MAG: radical SAM protein [Myxococcales bacterium]|nr:radical SAM protein [Myxococcales bacterium]